MAAFKEFRSLGRLSTALANAMEAVNNAKKLCDNASKADDIVRKMCAKVNELDQVDKCEFGRLKDLDSAMELLNTQGRLVQQNAQECVQKSRETDVQVDFNSNREDIIEMLHDLCKQLEGLHQVLSKLSAEFDKLLAKMEDACQRASELADWLSTLAADAKKEAMEEKEEAKRAKKEAKRVKKEAKKAAKLAKKEAKKAAKLAKSRKTGTAGVETLDQFTSTLTTDLTGTLNTDLTGTLNTELTGSLTSIGNESIQGGLTCSLGRSLTLPSVAPTASSRVGADTDGGVGAAERKRRLKRLASEAQRIAAGMRECREKARRSAVSPEILIGMKNVLDDGEEILKKEASVLNGLKKMFKSTIQRHH